MTTQTKQRVIIAMSGGVDSSVCALLMANKNYDCIGMTMRLWTGKETTTKKSCCGAESVDDARLVADKVGIPYYSINFQKDFWDQVIEVFGSEYLNGRTPSPCILCNEKLKFAALYDKAEALGGEKICTGHYARVKFDEETKRWNLLKGKDDNKDQSYYLFSLSQKQLSKTLFPLGDYTKDEIRALARKEGLITANKPESQDICFIPDGNYKKFIEKNFKKKLPQKGIIKDVNGETLGEHEGIHSFTVGQRKGLGIAFGKPLYVTSIDAKTNEVTLGERKDTYQKEFMVKKTNWISREPSFDEEVKLHIKIRARTKESLGSVIRINESYAKVIFDKPQHAITPGQAAVFYEGESVFGGGWIV